MKKPVIDRNRPLGLYLHIPFCKAKCAYCDFYSLPHSEEKMDAYAAALARHITEVAPQMQNHHQLLTQALLLAMLQLRSLLVDHLKPHPC